MEGTRPLLVELQALVSPTSYSSPRRSTTGIEFNRLLQILAVLESGWVFPSLNWMLTWHHPVGSMWRNPAADLDGHRHCGQLSRPVGGPRLVLIGEVGLGGQVRPISQLELRLKEASKLGFKRAIVPKSQAVKVNGLEVTEVSRVVDAIAQALKSA